MISVILCNRVGPLEQALRNRPGPVRYLSLLQTREGQTVRDFLAEWPGADELPKGALFRERSESFREKYIAFMGDLNIRNHSLNWWSMPFTNKNPLTTTLCRDTSSFLLIVSLVGETDDTLVVVTDSQDLTAQVKDYCRKQSVDYLDLVSGPSPLRTLLKLHTPAGPIKAFFRTFVLFLASPRFKRQTDTDGDWVVVSTLLHPGTFSVGAGFRDAYFGPLADHISQSGRKALVFGIPAEQPWAQLKKVRSGGHPLAIYPVESFLTLKDLVTSTWAAIKLALRPMRLDGPIEIDGIDVGCLVKRSVNDAVHSGDVMLNLRLHRSAQNLAKTLGIARCLYPYENRSWEKMLVLGIRSVSPQANLVGYQHTSVTKSHTNFIMGDKENEVLPLPDTILTTGEVVKSWLEEEGNYPSGIFKSACALRQQVSAQITSRPRPQPLKNIFVPLATSLQEYIDTMLLLEQAFAGRSEFNVRVRAHPIIPLESALSITPLSDTRFFSVSNGPLADDLDWADVVLYASSTVAMEGISRGIPAVQLNLGEFLDTDPMTGLKEFKWSAHDGPSLLEVLREIDAVPDDRFAELQETGGDYVRGYLRPVTTDALDTFIS